MSPSRTLPTFARAELEKHNTKKSCYVSIGSRVFDVTDFIDSHPGGGELVLEYGGKDVAEILKDDSSHFHSDAAYEVLEDSFIGFVVGGKAGENSQNGHSATSNGSSKQGDGTDSEAVYAATGMSSEDDLTRDTDLSDDYKKHKFLDLNKPLLMQVWFGGFSKEFYLEQVHRPRHYKGGESAPLFGNFLEPLTKTPWWIIPVMWFPPVVYGMYIASEGCSSVLEQGAYFSFGVFLWTLIEYGLHRFLFHLDK